MAGELEKTVARARLADRLRGRQFLMKLGLSLLLAAVFMWLVARGGVPIIPPSKAFSTVTWWSVPVYVVLLLLTHGFRAARWRFLMAPIKPVSLREALLVNWISFFAIFAFPMRLGEMVRPALTKLRHGVPMSVGVGTVAVERVVDGLLTSLAVLWALAMMPRRDSSDELVRALPYYGYLAASLFGGVLAALLLFLWQRRFAVRVVEFVFSRAPRLGRFIADRIVELADGVRSIAMPHLAAGFVFESLLYWGFNVFGMWVLAIGCGLDMSLAQAVAVLGILSIGILLPAGPGLFGTFQLAMSLGLKLYFADAVVGSEGAVFIFLMYVIQVLVHVVTGLLPLYAVQLSLDFLIGGSKNATPSPRDVPL